MAVEPWAAVVQETTYGLQKHLELPVSSSPNLTIGLILSIHPSVKATMLVPEPKHRGTMKEADRTYQQKTWEFMQEMVVEW